MLGVSGSPAQMGQRGCPAPKAVDLLCPLCEASELVTCVAAPDDDLGIVQPASSSSFGPLPHTEPCRR